MKEYNVDKKHVLKKLNSITEKYPLLISSIDGEIDCDVFVDEDYNLDQIILVNKLGWVYVIGDNIDETNKKEIIEILKEKYIDMYEYLICFGAKKDWIGYIDDFMNRNSSYVPRLQFKFDFENYNPYKEVNKYSIENVNMRNIEKSIEFDSGITDFWSSKTEFLEKGFGFNLIIDDEIACQIISAALSNREVEISIITSRNHRKKGLAYILSSYFLDYCIDNNLIPKWDCIKDNLSSKKLAKKLGFEIVNEYPVVVINCK